MATFDSDQILAVELLFLSLQLTKSFFVLCFTPESKVLAQIQVIGASFLEHSASTKKLILVVGVEFVMC